MTAFWPVRVHILTYLRFLIVYIATTPTAATTGGERETPSTPVATTVDTAATDPENTTSAEALDVTAAVQSVSSSPSEKETKQGSSRAGRLSYPILNLLLVYSLLPSFLI